MEKNIQQFTLKNTNGMIVNAIDYGGTITNIFVPGADGKIDDVVLGFDTPEEYLQEANPFFGCITGRYANRIAKGKFSIDGKHYQLPVNNSENTLHGGIEGFNRKTWKAEQSGNKLKLTYTSPDGEEGFPGNLSCEITYSLNENNELRLDYLASTDSPTILNLTNHTYFNLSGEKTIHDHEMFIDADRFVEVDEQYIPTGRLQTVDGSVMDFRTSKTIGKDLPEIKGGFDHTWVFGNRENELVLASAVYHPGTKRRMETWTTEPGMQFYTSNFLDGKLKGKNGARYQRHSGFCLETQHFPDSPHHPSFPNTVLRPGEQYRQTTIYKFSVK